MWDQGPPGGDDVASGGHIKNDDFFNENLIRNGSIWDQGPPGGDDEDLAQEALEVKMVAF